MADYEGVDVSEATDRIERKLSYEAGADNKRMTVGELREYVRALDDARIGVGVEVKASVTFAGYLKKIEV